MRPNLVKEKMLRGEKVINGWLTIPSSLAAEVMAQQAFDSLTIDLQHGLIDYTNMVPMLQAINTKTATPLVRVPWFENGIIMKALDAGAYGIICPMVNTAEDAENFVQACSYAPRGRRSFGPMRALMYAGVDYQENANDTVLKLAMIETKQALSNMEAIMATSGLDGVYVGPSDLGLSMGYKPRLDTDEPEVLKAIHQIKNCAKEKGLLCAVHTAGAAYANAMLEQGFDMISVSSEARLLTNAAMDFISEARGNKKADKVAGY